MPLLSLNKTQKGKTPRHVCLHGRSYPFLGSPGRRVSKREFLCSQNGSPALSGVLFGGPVDVSNLYDGASSRFAAGTETS